MTAACPRPPTGGQRVVPSGTWKIGTTEIGVGDGGETTVIVNRPVVYVRTVFDVGDPAAITGLTLDMLADDGAVAYLNGVEVVRDNVGPGPVDNTTPASSYRWTVADETTLLTHPIPVGALQPGANVLAISVHNGPGSSDISFDAVLTASYGANPDVEPPTAPTGLTQTAASSTSVTLGWEAATDDVGVAGYRVFRNGVQVAETNQVQVIIDGLPAGDTASYSVSAYDAAGNVGPLSAPIDATTAAPSLEPIALNHVWRYLDTGIDPGPGWFQPGFADGSWSTGAAELGAGDGDETTVIVNRPVVWFRTTFAVQSPAQISSALLSMVVDDGAVVYLNGVEVARDNMPVGPIGPDTPAASYRWTRADETALRDFPLPASLLVAGANTLAVSVHNGPGSIDLSFAAQLVLQGGGVADTEPPSAPGPIVAGSVGTTSATLSWAPATDNVAVESYEVLRDGAVVATVFTPSIVDSGLAPSTAYTYRVRARDAAGNVGPLSPPLTVTTEDEVVPPLVIVPAGATWRYLDTGVLPAADWNTVGFDIAASDVPACRSACCRSAAGSPSVSQLDSGLAARLHGRRLRRRRELLRQRRGLRRRRVERHHGRGHRRAGLGSATSTWSAPRSTGASTRGPNMRNTLNRKYLMQAIDGRSSGSASTSSTSSSATGPTPTPPSRRRCGPCPTSSTAARPCTGAPRSGRPTRSAPPGRSPSATTCTSP
jgi:chitodextrinase